MTEKQALQTPISAFLEHVKADPEKIFLRQPVDGDYIDYSYADAASQIQRMASRLSELPARSHVAIISYNCAHWIMADLAIMLAGHISIPIYPTASTSTVAQILEHSGCRLVFVGKMPDWQSKNYLIPNTIETISMHTEHPGMESWTGITSRYLPIDFALPDLDALCSIIYTSGTTGLPKGVMTSYKTLANAGQIITDWMNINKTDRFFSYLPLAHAAEKVVVATAGVYSGGVISFAESMDTFNSDIKASQVTILLGVPKEFG